MSTFGLAVFTEIVSGILASDECLGGGIGMTGILGLRGGRGGVRPSLRARAFGGGGRSRSLSDDGRWPSSDPRRARNGFVDGFGGRAGGNGADLEDIKDGGFGGTSVGLKGFLSGDGGS